MNALGDSYTTGGSGVNDGTLEFQVATDLVNSQQFRVGEQGNAAQSVVGDTGGGILLNNGTGVLTFTSLLFNGADNDTIADRNLTLGGNNSGANTITGEIRQHTNKAANFTLTKEGTGTWNLNGDNTYTGNTTVSAGQLNIGGTNVSEITVASGANLGGEGTTAGNITFQGTTYTLDVEGSTVGALGTTGDLDLTAVASGNFTININSAGPGTFNVLTYGLGGNIGFGDTSKFALGTAPAASGRGGGSGVLTFTTTAITYDGGFEEKIWVGGISGNWNINNEANWSGGSDALFFDGDSVIFGDSATDFTPTLTEDVRVTNATFTGTDVTKDYTLSGGNLTVDGVLTVATGNILTTSGGYDVTLASNITGSGSLFIGDNNGIQNASQDTVTISGNNSYTGGTTIAEGRVSITHNNALGTGTVTIDESAGLNRDAILDLDLNGIDLSNNIVIGDVGGKQIRFDEAGSATATISGDILNTEVSDTNFRIDVGNSDTVTVTGKVSGTHLTLRANNQANQGNVILANAGNDFTGSLLVAANVSVASIGNAGQASHAGAGNTIILGLNANNTLTNNNNQPGLLNYTGSGNTTNKQVQVGNFWFSNAHTDPGIGGTIANNGSGALIFSNDNFSLQETTGVRARIGARTLTLAGSFTGTNEIDGVIKDNTTTDALGFDDETVGITVDTSGAWQLDGVNTYTGNTTVTAGSLLVNGSTAAGSAVVVNGGTLGGSGTINGNITVNTGGNHTAGTTGTATPAATQTIGGNLSYAAGSSVTWDLISNATTTGTAGDHFDMTAGAGTLEFASVTSFILDFNGSGGTGVAGDGSVLFAEDAFWGSDKEWAVYTGAGTLTDFANLVIDPTSLANLTDAGGNLFSASRPGGVFAINNTMGTNNITLNYTAAIPEPGTYGIFGLGLALFGWTARRRRRKQAAAAEVDNG